MEEDGFLLEIQQISFDLERVIEKYGVRDRVMQLMVVGILDEDIIGDTRLKAIYSYHIESDDELKSIINFVTDTWKEDEDDDEDIDLSDLLDGTGVELE
jgi:hypothetical protein|tara:strand:+ start:1134 stop:1430 length:297 start_codon:yes stop_codon:yes gene_type:complete